MPKYAMRCSFGIYVFFLGYVHVYGQPCTNNSLGHTVYGPGCKYLCHCKIDSEQCDYSTGSCVSGCANKWMGPGCQYRDILRRKKASQSESTDAYKAVDGRLDTCSSSRRRDGPLWWRAWFRQAEMIRGLIIVTEDAQKGYFLKFKVYVENNTKRTDSKGFQLQETCYEHDEMSPLTTTISITCVRPIRGNQVRIQLASNMTRLVLCDVRMFGGRNLAYSKYTRQSSTYWPFVSSYAVDGALKGLCADTDSRNPPHTWTVDLGNIFRVQALQLMSLYNVRSNDTIQVGVDGSSYPVQFTPSEDKTVLFTLDEDVRYLRFSSSRRFFLCEVLIYGDCLDYKCGLDCSISCHCAVFTFENKVSGECLEGCAPGWMGQGRRCDTECPDGTYGQGCSGRCQGKCRCDKRDGRCIKGCYPGWKGHMCNEECSIGYYGSGCQERCSSHCVDNDVCDKIEGRCPRGCAAGWMGDKCDAGCVVGLYGPNCSQVCSEHCSPSRVCYPSDGRCENGCGSGWQGEKCVEQCSIGYYGSGCQERCSSHCVDNDVCDKVEGRCPRGCAAGWMGDKCDAECPVETFGENCSEHCSNNCVENGVCDKVTGYCPLGCAAGWMGSRCNTGCVLGLYGPNCSQVCSEHCSPSRVCYPSDGRCENGCESGWQGEKCDEQIICPVHTFGSDCTPCGPCKNGSCDPVTGECPSGCYDGYVGSMCETFNIDAMYIVNAVLVGAEMGVIIVLLVAAVIVAVLWKIKQRPHIYGEPLAMTYSGPIYEPAYDTCRDQGRQNGNDSDQEHVYVN